MAYESLDAQVDELVLYACNFSAEHYCPTDEMVCKQWVKHGKGNAAQGWDYRRALGYVKRALIDPAAKDYKRCHGSMTQSWHEMWPIPIREMAARRVLSSWLAEYELGNLSWEKPVK